ncbi:MAG: TolC family protein, partial [Myxococcota bacterium]|nr:TolC family protein [Myxococcota bacterium]
MRRTRPGLSRSRHESVDRPRMPAVCGALATILLAGLPVIAEPRTQPLEIPVPLDLEWCVERAREANPDLERAAASSAAASHRVASAGTLDDPRFTYTASNVPVGDLDFDSTPLSGHQLGLLQKLPFPGLLTSRRRAAEGMAESAELLLEDQRQVTRGAVESAWAELGFSQQALGITRQNLALLRKLSATAESRYRVGSGLQQDVLRAQVELTALLQDELRRTEGVRAAESVLAEILDLPAGTPLPDTADIRLDAATPPLEQLIASVESGNARIAADRKAVDAAEARVRAAELEGLPDLDLGIGYRVRQSVPGD